MGNNYMIVSTFVLIAAFIPFAAGYEKRRPKAREIIVVALLSAIAAIANVLCAMTIPLHAGTAIVVVTGIALGSREGLLVGGLSRFICNMALGQGPWTPWEMAAWAILGFMAGLLFNKREMTGILDDRKRVRKKEAGDGMRASLPYVISIVFWEVFGYVEFLLFRQEGESFWGYRLYIFGFLGIVTALIFSRKKLPANMITETIYTVVSVFVIYGGIMNFAALMMTGGNIDALKLLYITGAPYDALHALGAGLCVILFGDSIVIKLQRIKIKFGLYST